MATDACRICKKAHTFGLEGIQRKNVGLLAAAYAGHIDCVETFIREGANVNCSDRAFTLDCRRNIYSLVGCTIRPEYGCSRTFRDPFSGVDYCTPLFYAAVLGHIQIIKCLVRKGVDVNLVKLQTTALSMTAASGQYGSMKCLIEAGANVNVFHELAEPPLISATRFHKISRVVKCIDLLIKAGADVNTPYFTAKTGQTTPLVECIKCGTRRIVSKLLDVGASVDLGSGGKFPLYEAIGDKRLKCVELLVEAGADVNQLNDYSETPMYRAARALQRKSVNLLLEYGADVNTPDNRGMSPLMIAAMLSSRKLDCHINRMNKILRFKKRYIEIFCGLLRGGAHINYKDRSGKNALEIAISSYFSQNHKKKFFMLLYTAGETLDGATTAADGISKITIPKFIEELKDNIDLKHLCREAIRKHLIDVNPYENLFGRIAQLGLPSIVNNYLLYNCTLDHDNKDDDYDDNGDDNYN